MNWTKPYIVVRPNEQGELKKVHETETIKDARYWLSYIALPGDAIFQTPAHPKHTNGDSPCYKAHLVKRGEVGYDEATWRQVVNVAEQLNIVE